MAHTLTDDQVVREVFCLIDKDSDGFISMEELASVIQTLDDANPIKEDQNMMMMMMVINEADDIERKGKIDFEDFVNIMARKMQENVVDELKEAFKVFDLDQDGFISANELRQVMMNMGEKLTMEEAEQMIREADLDGDGVVSFDEFARMMMVAL